MVSIPNKEAVHLDINACYFVLFDSVKLRYNRVATSKER